MAYENNALYEKNEDVIAKADNQYEIVSALMAARESDMITISVTDDVELLFRSAISIHECEEMINENRSPQSIGTPPTRKTATQKGRYSNTKSALDSIDSNLSLKYTARVNKKKRKIKLLTSVIFLLFTALLTYGLFKLANIIDDSFEANVGTIHEGGFAVALEIGGGILALVVAFFFNEKRFGLCLLFTIFGALTAVIGGIIFFCEGHLLESFIIFIGCDGIIAVGWLISCLNSILKRLQKSQCVERGKRYGMI